MSYEQPSSAFLAGQAHGASLAAKPKPPAKAAPHGGARPKPKPAKSAGGSSGGGAASVTDLLNTDTSLPLQELLKRAATLARGDVDAQVRAIQAVQAQERARAAAQAKEILAASQASAGMLGGVGDQTAASFTNAAKDIAGFAQGFSGDLRDTASAEAQRVLDQLKAVGASNLAPEVAGQAGALQNVLYGLGGNLPASALLTGGTALAAAQRGLPASTLAFGQEQARGAVAAGDQAAREYDPKLVDARGGLSDKTRQYVSLISGLQKDAFDRKLDTMKYLTGVEEFKTSTALSKARLDLDAKQFAERIYESDRDYQLALGNFGLSQKRLALEAIAQDYKLKNGGFSKVQINKFENDAAFVASQAQGAKKTPTLEGAMQEMRARHVPLSIAQNALRKTGLYTIPTSSERNDYNRLVGAGEDVASIAKPFLGVPYSWGGGTPSGPTRGFNQGAKIVGYDCSSFVQAVYAKAGIQLPRTTYAQVKVGRPVSLNDLEPGDLVFTRPGKNGPNHVGLYIGNGQVQESPHTGSVNRVVALRDYLSGGFVAARRVKG